MNFYENDFTDELGSLLTDSKNVDVDANYSKFSPASSLNGEMKKKWVIENGIRYLMKVNANDYGQQSINEVITKANFMKNLVGIIMSNIELTRQS